LFKADDAGELKRLIDEMRKNTEARLAMGVESRKKVLNDHDWKVLAKKHLTYFIK
jgi:glycosyltransferase involved in cell wall biosynthesis